MQYDAADDAGAGGCAHPDFEFAAEEVVFGLDGGGIAARRDGEVGAAVLGVLQGTGGLVPGCANGGVGEMVGVLSGESRVSRAVGGVERIARGPCLRDGRRREEGGEQREGGEKGVS